MVCGGLRGSPAWARVGWAGGKIAYMVGLIRDGLLLDVGRLTSFLLKYVYFTSKYGEDFDNSCS